MSDLKDNKLNDNKSKIEPTAPTPDELKQYSLPHKLKSYICLIIPAFRGCDIYRRVPKEVIEPFLLYLDGTINRKHDARIKKYMAHPEATERGSRENCPWPIHNFEYKKFESDLILYVEANDQGYIDLDHDESLLIGSVEY